MLNNPYKPREVIERNKALSDYNNLSNDLTIKGSQAPGAIKGSSTGNKRLAAEKIKDRLEIKALEMQTDDSYFYSLLEDSF